MGTQDIQENKRSIFFYGFELILFYRAVIFIVIVEVQNQVASLSLILGTYILYIYTHYHVIVAAF